MIGQIILGGLLVLTELDPRFTMGHFLLSMVLIWNAVVLDHRARLAEHTQITAIGDHRWQVVQVLLDPSDENLWCVEGTVDLSDDANVEGPLITVTRIGT